MILDYHATFSLMMKCGAELKLTLYMNIFPYLIRATKKEWQMRLLIIREDARMAP